MEKSLLKFSALLLCLATLFSSCEKPKEEDENTDPNLEEQSNVNENSGWTRLNHVIYTNTEIYGIDNKGYLDFQHFEASDNQCHLVYSEYIRLQQGNSYRKHYMASFDANGTLIDTQSFAENPEALSYKVFNKELYRIAGTITNFALYKGLDLISTCPQSPWAGTPTFYKGDFVQWISPNKLLGYRLEQANGYNGFNGEVYVGAQYYVYDNGTWSGSYKQSIGGLKMPKGSYDVLGVQEYQGEIYSFYAGFDQFPGDSLTIGVAVLKPNTPSQSNPHTMNWDSVYVGKIPFKKSNVRIPFDPSKLAVDGSKAHFFVVYDDYDTPVGTHLLKMSFDFSTKKLVQQTNFIASQYTPKFTYHNGDWYFYGNDLNDPSNFQTLRVYRFSGATIIPESQENLTKNYTSIQHFFSGNNKLYGIVDNAGVATSKNGVIYIISPK
jgi:hypothetical protein